MKTLKALFIFAVLICVLSGGRIWAQDCKTTIILESVKYQGETVGVGGQKVDQFAVSWGARRACGTGGRAGVVLKIKRLTKEETASAFNIDSSRISGNLINLTIPRGALETDPKSWTVTITHTSTSSSVRSIRVSGQGNPDLSTATIGPIPGGPIGENLKKPSVLEVRGDLRNASVEPGVWRPKSATAPDLLPVQVPQHSGTSGTCFPGSITVIGLVHTAGQVQPQINETVKVDWKGIAPSCEKIVSYSVKSNFTLQDGTTKNTGPITFGGTLTTQTFFLPFSQSPIVSYFIDITFTTQLEDINRGPFTLTQSGNF